MFVGETRSVQVVLGGDKLSYLASPLVENVKYVFSVKARTSVGWGKSRYGNITTGPQPGIAYLHFPKWPLQ